MSNLRRRVSSLENRSRSGGPVVIYCDDGESPADAERRYRDAHPEDRNRYVVTIDEIQRGL